MNGRLLEAGSLKLAVVVPLAASSLARPGWSATSAKLRQSLALELSCHVHGRHS